MSRRELDQRAIDRIIEAREYICFVNDRHADGTLRGQYYRFGCGHPHLKPWDPAACQKSEKAGSRPQPTSTRIMFVYLFDRLTID